VQHNVIIDIHTIGINVIKSIFYFAHIIITVVPIAKAIAAVSGLHNQITAI